MCDFTAAETRAIAAAYGVDEDFAPELEHLAPLTDHGLVTVADAGRLFVRLVRRRVRRLRRGTQRHSAVVRTRKIAAV